jgi:hypothetical protein
VVTLKTYLKEWGTSGPGYGGDISRACMACRTEPSASRLGSVGLQSRQEDNPLTAVGKNPAGLSALSAPHLGLWLTAPVLTAAGPNQVDRVWSEWPAGETAPRSASFIWYSATSPAHRPARPAGRAAMTE